MLVIFRNAGGSPFSTGSFPSGTYLAIPAAELRAGDYHSVVAGASDAFSGTTRRVRRIYTAAMNFTAVMLPEPQSIRWAPWDRRCRTSGRALAFRVRARRRSG